MTHVEGSSSTNNIDPASKYGTVNPNNRNSFKCNFCDKTTNGGARRLKEHLVGGFRNVKACPKCPEHIRLEVRDFMLKKAACKDAMDPLVNDIVDEEDEECMVTSEKRAGGSKQAKISKKTRQKGPMDMFYAPKPEDILKGRKGGRQQSINEVLKKELRGNVCRELARWFYDANLPFNAATYDSFRKAMAAVAQFGPGFDPPSMYELRVPFLRQEVEDMKIELDHYKKEWAQKGCSILSDGWCDSTVQKDIVNFLVNSPRGSVFMKSIDVSEITKDGDTIYMMLDEMVEEVGEEYVVQIVTDNASNYVKAGELLMAKRKHLYWTPCASHCLDLILEDIGKIPKVKNCLKSAMFMNGYIYTHVRLVNLMRRFTNQKNLHRPAITRFATSFITLSQIHKHKSHLREMITSKEWADGKWSKEAKGKKVASIILSDRFWRNVVYALKLTSPLVKVLRMVDGDKKSAMGYIYKAMDKAKETIESCFSYKKEEYEVAFGYIDRRWECQLHRPLHAAGFF